MRGFTSTQQPPGQSGLSMSWTFLKSYGQHVFAALLPFCYQSTCSGVILTNEVVSWINKMLPQYPYSYMDQVRYEGIYSPSNSCLYYQQCGTSGSQRAKLLLYNCAHLVLLVNITLERSASVRHIDTYCHHNQAYIKSSLIPFEDVNLAPNYHMAIHLADCLEKYYDCISPYWISHSTPLHSGQMEITFMTKVCQMGNLRALLDMLGLPQSIQPHIEQLKSLYNSIPLETSTETCHAPQ
ncbi:hypothetical protein VP01_134g6 [Puccinia sorghi]|uniref:Uncharacterized protein n=1 Tax=Puccinia sorghi TaxID=27349 RepID=A0A0L6VM70_9BASI|nr:hypothetical protein VP01_134g6 [Puccinia sorghi]